MQSNDSVLITFIYDLSSVLLVTISRTRAHNFVCSIVLSDFRYALTIFLSSPVSLVIGEKPFDKNSQNFHLKLKPKTRTQSLIEPEELWPVLLKRTLFPNCFFFLSRYCMCSRMSSRLVIILAVAYIVFVNARLQAVPIYLSNQDYAYNEMVTII